MSDFTLKISNLPTDKELMGPAEKAGKAKDYGQHRDGAYSARTEETLKTQLWDHLRRILMANDSSADGLLGGSVKLEPDGKTPDGAPGSDLFEIVDICFGKTQHEETEKLVSLFDCHREIVRHQHTKISRFAPQAAKAKFKERLQSALDRFNTKKKEYRKYQEALDAYRSGRSPTNPMLNNQIDQERTIQYAFVVFRS